MFVSLSIINLITLPFWLIVQFFKRSWDDFVYLLFSELAWRAGIGWSLIVNLNPISLIIKKIKMQLQLRKDNYIISQLTAKNLGQPRPDIYTNQKKIIFSPHFDDFIFSLGGLAQAFDQRNLPVEDVVIFSQTNYLENNDLASQDASAENIERVSQLRFNEELSVIKKFKNAAVKLGGIDEAKLRGWSNVIVSSSGYCCDQADRIAQEKISDLFDQYLRLDVQIFFPLGIGSHIDHLIIRDLLLAGVKKGNIKAKIFFYEDLPYAGSIAPKEWHAINSLIIKYQLQPLAIPIDLASKLELAQLYQTQFTPDLGQYLLKRAKAVGRKSQLGPVGEQIYILNF